LRIKRTGNYFAAQIAEEVVQLKDFTKKVWQESLLELVWRMQRTTFNGGHMPIRTGWLRSSLMVSTAPVPSKSMKKPSEDMSYGWAMTEVFPIIKNARIGETIYMGYGAPYVDVQELRYGFQRLAIQSWPTIVEQVQSRLGG
jgi:hypothetical protein